MIICIIVLFNITLRMAAQPRLLPDIIGMMGRDFKVSYDDAEAVMTALENFFLSLDQQNKYDCKSERRDVWTIGATVYSNCSCTLLEATIYRTNEPNVYIITSIYADYLDRDMYRSLCNKMIIYLADHVYQQCVHSRNLLEMAQINNREINQFLGFNLPQVQMQREIVVEIINRELPQLLSIYFEHNLSASQSLSSIVKNNDVCDIIGEMVVDEYAAYLANQNDPQQEYRVGNAILFVDVALKYAIGRPIREGEDHIVSLETRTLCAYALCHLVNNVNCANYLRDVNAVAGCELVLAALDDSAKNYVLKKKMRELKDRLNPVIMD